MGVYSYVGEQGWINLDDRELASTRTEALSLVGVIRSDSTLQEFERSGQIPTPRRRDDVED